MRRLHRLSPLLSPIMVAAALAAGASPLAIAETTRPQVPAAECNDTQGAAEPFTRFAGLPPPPAPAPVTFDVADQQAALESVQYALSSIGDGSTYVWHRHHGKLSGIVQPTQSFKDAEGKICRHFIVTFSSGSYSKRTETVACRTANGIWQLDG